MIGNLLKSIAVSALLLLAAVSGAAAAQIVGEAEVIRRTVTGAGVQGTRNLAISDRLYENERISAGDSSHGELRLNDDSKVIVGSNSTIKLDSFVTGGTGFSTGAINVVKGAFRFVTGSSSKGSFRVKTPLSTVGIRGTIFDVYVEPGRELFVLFDGAIQVCTNAGICRTSSRNCDIIEVRSPTDITKPPFFGSARSGIGEQEVSLTGNQRRFKRSWRAPLRACQARAAMEAIERRGTDSGPAPSQTSTGGRNNRGSDPDQPNDQDVPDDPAPLDDDDDSSSDDDSFSDDDTFDDYDECAAFQC